MLVKATYIMNHQYETRQSVCPHDAMKLSEEVHAIAIYIYLRRELGMINF